MRPAIISTEVEKVRDIAVTSYERDLCACAAITEENKVYIWARCGGQNVWEPILTLCSSLDELFTGNASPPAITYQHLQLQITNLESKTKCPIIKRLQESFDKPETADFAFIVEGKKIHVHKNLLIFGSDVFKNLFLGDWKDSCQKEMVVEDHSYDAFYAFLKYFYTDEVDFTPELALEVFAVAHFYRVMDLMEECEKILKTGLTVQNAAAVFEKAILFGAKDLCKFCFEFCQRHLAYVVNNFVSDDCKREVFLEVFRQAAIQKNKK
ncbi:RCC1 and BTB domain-containing protein 1-like [Cloeon dipterum]|uniref:RCC1 and BTB domain-containing protein 1-like n=1 Tax=Cloeon dipterum TaxID=197152 RepID=UPI00321F8A3B